MYGWRNDRIMEWPDTLRLLTTSFTKRKKQTIYVTVLLETGLAGRTQGVQFALSQNERYPSDVNQYESQV